ncbi:PIN domain-like protein [Hygrophoropsis aurantiaca]|uniref:PIN domain-like protein n=1 Tax=Hygrophoropsis aurantiaca TaxID=72124 RepID=A0ACB7ZX68_9AGAM|nr:PIN domain-like protein [Hygrophoropsis aurantiaca]
MGVLGLTPFLQKICPNVIRRLPDRLKSLSGKTIVIDGTLITQRLHFAPLPHPYRHVLGWHRILTELKENNVHTICVFDGQQRSAAKAREVERRREIRRLDKARGSIETGRLIRLQKLQKILFKYHSLDTSAKQRITEAFAGATSDISQADKIQPFITLNAGLVGEQQLYQPIACDSHPTAVPQDAFAHEVSEADLREIIYTQIEQRVTNPIDQNDQSIEEIDELQAATRLDWSPTLDQSYPTPFYQVDDDIGDTLTAREDVIISVLSSLYHEYQQCVTQLTSMPSAQDILTSEFPANTDEARVEYAMSKSQLQMTYDEGHIWNKLVAPPEVPVYEDSIPAQESLVSLTERSSIISDSYQRRTNPPTPETYEACKEIIRAMGVPCIESSGPFEAEALAASLVINGYADYVASEDTDVLVYEAPLIRNIANRDGPLIIVSGSEVRSALQLDRSSYIDFLLLLGTDFSQRIKNVGPQRALKFIREHGSIERVIEQESKYPPRIPVSTFIEQVEVARLVFQTLPPVPPPELLQPTESISAEVSEIIQRYRLHPKVADQWNYRAALDGNYFSDNPSAI